MNPSRALRVGDEIVAVNGYEGADIQYQLASKQRLILAVERHQPMSIEALLKAGVPTAASVKGVNAFEHLMKKIKQSNA